MSLEKVRGGFFCLGAFYARAIVREVLQCRVFMTTIILETSVINEIQKIYNELCVSNGVVH